MKAGRYAGNGRWIEGWKRSGDFASPQQLGGISNVRSWNVRNAGQSDLSEKEGWRGRMSREPELEKRGMMGKSVASLKLNTAGHCECGDTTLVLVEGLTVTRRHK